MKQQELPSKVYEIGKSKVIIYSPLADMTKEEQKNFYDQEWAKGNPILQEIMEATADCLRHSREVM